MIAFAARIAAIVPIPMANLPEREASITGSISSEVAKKTASMVPRVTVPVE